MTDPIHPEVAILNAALEHPPERRGAFLDEACAGNPALREQVESLLQAEAMAGAFFQDTTTQPGVRPSRPREADRPEQPGDVIGPYTLMEALGEGGCGVVFRARQETPIRREVAFKVIKLGMDTKSVLARFDAERQALAMMDHPNIARVLDAGAIPAGPHRGRPYFVMELVRGPRITDYCDQHELTTRERLHLFIQVCHAVQHAHQKGIIHRDIKPSNVLVAEGRPGQAGIPKVIDFGIAKATQGPLTDQTLFTAVEQFLGTPAYMSPEQAGGVPVASGDIDTRSDIYSLGVLLYELLTGKTPFDAEQLLGAGLEAMIRVLREQEPARPSTRLSSMVNEELTVAARRRQTEPPKLIHLVRGDLDWIVMKTLEKDRTRRYESADSLAADVQRHLGSEPVTARPPSSLYRFQRLVRRNRLAFAAGAAVALALLLGIVASSWQAVRATRAEHGQSRLRQEAEQRLYDSLLGEARAIRAARLAGYRDQVFALLQRARSLPVLHHDPVQLAREATSCLGDYVGLAPVMLDPFPEGTSIPVMSQVHLDPSGRWAAFPLSDGSILLRDTETGRDVARLRTDQPVWQFEFDADGERILSVHMPENETFRNRLPAAMIHVWTRTADGAWEQTVGRAASGAYQCLRAGNRWFIVVHAPEQGGLQLWDVEQEAMDRVVPFPETFRIDRWRALPAMSPDGRWLAIQAAQEIEVWDLAEGRSAARLVPGLFGLSQLDFSPDGRHLIALSGRGCVIYEAPRFRHVATLAESANAWVQFASSPSSHLALPMFEQKGVRLWDALRNKDVAVLNTPFTPYMADYSADGRWLLVAGVSNACLFRTELNLEKVNLAGHALSVPCLAFNLDGTRLVAVDRGRGMKLWDTARGRLLWERSDLPDQGGQSVAFSTDGRLLATSHWSSHIVSLWEAATGRHLQTLQTGNRPAQGGVGWSVRFTPDGRYLVSTHTPSGPEGANFGLMMWPLLSDTNGPPCGEVSHSVQGRFYNLAISPDSRHMAFVNFFSETKLHLWDYRSDQPPEMLTSDILRSGQNAAFTPDGRHLVFLNAERKVVRYDLSTRSTHSSFPTTDAAHPETWTDGPHLALSPDGERVAITALSRRAVEVRDMSTGHLRHTLPEEASTIFWMDWSPDGRRIAVSRSSGEVAIWNLAEVDRVLAELGLGLHEAGQEK